MLNYAGFTTTPSNLHKNSTEKIRPHQKWPDVMGVCGVSFFVDLNPYRSSWPRGVSIPTCLQGPEPQ